MTAAEKVDKLQDSFDELETISGLIDTTRDLFEILYQETDDTNLSEDHLQYHYRRISILANSIFERLHEENEQLKKFFNKAHAILFK